MNALNPAMRVGDQIAEVLVRHRGLRWREAREQAVSLLGRMRLGAPRQRVRQYPFELSGGMQQRVMIAIALACRPALLIADEPTTALDVTVQEEVLALMQQVQREDGMAVVLITHDLGVVARMADDVAVMYAGQIVESGTAEAVLTQPAHPYTRALIRALPRLGSAGAPLAAIPGNVPLPGRFPSGCRFHPRCAVAKPDCARVAPELVEANAGHVVRCPYWQS
jgi:oligopeptide/dipeptide ABC transporter ATP-binding protein